MPTSRVHPDGKHASEMSTLLPVSDSRIQHCFFKFIQEEADSEKILGKLSGYRLEGKSLSWFQDVIPELVPGQQGQQPWLEAAREMLWTPETRRDHVRLLEDTSALNSDAPPGFPTQDFGLRRLWPVVIDFLQPMSPQMVIAVNQVSTMLARTDCILPKDARAQDSLQSHERGPVSHNFIIRRQAVQDKILSPLIDMVEQQFQQACSRVATPTGDLEDLHIHDTAALKQQETDFLQEISRHDSDFRNALRNLRDVIVREKDTCDNAQTDRKRLHQEAPLEVDANSSTHRKVRRKTDP